MEKNRTSKSEEWRRLAEQALWIAHSLFDRGKTSGTTANLSFRYGDLIYITCSGSCFGTLQEDQLTAVTPDGVPVNPDGPKPSKEFTLHQILYQSSDKIRAVIHTHSPATVLWSCLPHENPRDVMPHITPYLDMKLGKVAEVPYAAPGSGELFQAMRDSIGPERGYLLKNHGGIVGGTSLMNAFEGIEELEQTAWLAKELIHCSRG